MLYVVHDSSRHPGFSNGAVGEPAAPPRTEAQANYEKLDRIHTDIRAWFCDTSTARVWDTLKFLICQRSGASDAQLIEKFYDLKALAGPGHQPRFSVVHGTEGTFYQVDLHPECQETLSFTIAAAVPSSYPASAAPSPQSLMWTAGAGLMAVAAYSYLQPDFRQRVLNHLCEEAYGLIQCSYDANQGWTEFALNPALRSQFSEFLSVAATRAADGSELLMKGVRLLIDHRQWRDFIAWLPAAALKHTVAIACWKLQLHLTRLTWQGVSGWLFQPAPPGPPSTLRFLLDTAGTYFSSGPVAQIKCMWNQAGTQCMQTPALSMPDPLDREPPFIELTHESRP